MKNAYYSADDYQASRSIGYLLRSSSKLMTQHVEALFADEEVSFVQWVILMNLRDKLATTAAELCQGICHDSGALTRVLEQLEKRGLIQKKRSQKDRRTVELKLTPAGQKAIQLVLPRIVGFLNNLLDDDFTKDEIDTLVNLLSRLKTKLSQLA